MLHELGDVLAEQGERRVGDDDVGRLENLHALGAAEIAPLLQGAAHILIVPEQVLDVLQVDRAVLVEVGDLVDLDQVSPVPTTRLAPHPLPPLPAIHRGEGVQIRLQPLHHYQRKLSADDGGAGVAGGDELLQDEGVEVGGEVLEEVALEGVVAVAEDDLALEAVLVMLELVGDVGELGVELVLLGRLGAGEGAIAGGGRHSPIAHMAYYTRAMAIRQPRSMPDLRLRSGWGMGLAPRGKLGQADALR